MKHSAASPSDSVALWPRVRAARVCGLLLRLASSETQHSELFGIVRGFFEALAALPEGAHETAEALAVLRILAVLGLDAGEIPGESADFTSSLLATVAKKRASYIARINRGITASGL